MNTYNTKNRHIQYIYVVIVGIVMNTTTNKDLKPDIWTVINI